MRGYDSRSYDGKVVAKLKYRLNDADVMIPVRLVQETKKVEQSRAPYKGKGSKPRHTTGCIFCVYLEEIGLKPGEEEPDSIEATDIEILRAAVMDKLDQEHELEWERWYLVKVTDGYCNDMDEIGLKLEWEPVCIAELPDGRKVHRMEGYRRTDNIRDGVPETGPGNRRRDGMTSLILATDENHKALLALRDRMIEVRELMMKFMAPDKIEQTLASATDRLLPKPKGTK